MAVWALNNYNNSIQVIMILLPLLLLLLIITNVLLLLLPLLLLLLITITTIIRGRWQSRRAAGCTSLRNYTAHGALRRNTLYV